MKKTVLLIDDDHFALYINQEIIQPFIATSLETYLQAKLALNFLATYLAENARVLIFLDLNMPEMNGWQFLDELRRSRFKSQVSVVIVTSSVDERDSFRAFEYPCVKGFIIKPVEEQTILALSEIEDIAGFFKVD